MTRRERQSPHHVTTTGPAGRTRRNRLAPPARASRRRIDPHVEHTARLRRELRADDRTAMTTASQARQPERERHAPAEDAPVTLVVAAPAEAWPGAQADLLGTARELAPEHAIALVALGEIACDPANDGADRVVCWGEPLSEAQQVHRLVALIEAWQPAHVLFAEGPVDGDLLRRLAAALGETPAVNVTLAERGRATQLIDGGQRQFVAAAPRLLGLTRAACAAYDGDLCFAATLLEPEIRLTNDEPGLFRDAGLLDVSARDLSLAEADLVISAGAGVRDWITFEAVAEGLSAAVGASRVVCDGGSLPRNRQVGASGSIIESRGYLALGISGAPQHLQGIKACRHVVAVNIDPHAPIMERADLAVVGDAQAVLASLDRLLHEATT